MFIQKKIYRHSNTFIEMNEDQSLEVVSFFSSLFFFLHSAIDGASCSLFFHRHPVYFFFSSLFSLVFRMVCVCVVYSYHCSHTTLFFLLYTAIARSPPAQGRVHWSVYTNNDGLIISSCSSSFLHIRSSTSIHSKLIFHIYINWCFA